MAAETSEAHSTATRVAAIAGLPAIGQVSFAVRDLDAVLPVFEALFGTYESRPIRVDPAVFTVRGKPADTSLRIALFRDHVPEVELIEVSEGEFLTSESARQHPVALHHLAFYLDDVDPPLEALLRLGFDEILAGSTPTGQRVRYVEAPPELGGFVFELFERPAPR